MTNLKMNLEKNSGMKILVVDDEELNRDMILNFVLDKHHEIHLADSVSSALDKINFEKYDIIICDHGLGDGNGSDVYKYIRRLELDPFYVAFSGYDYKYLSKFYDESCVIVEHKNFLKLGNVIKEFLLKQESKKSKSSLIEGIKNLLGNGGSYGQKAVTV